MTPTRLSDDYKQLNEEKHKNDSNWGCGTGERYETAIKAAGAHAKTALDYGCGKGNLRTFCEETFRYDPCNPTYSKRPRGSYDVVFCIDVLEHIEPNYVDNVLDDIHLFMNRHVLFVISTRKAKHVLSDGTNVHRTIKPLQWWHKKLKECYSNVNYLEEYTNAKPGDAVFLASKKLQGFCI